MGGIIAIDTQNHCSLFIEKQQRWREHDAERCGERLLRRRLPVEPRHLAVTPDVDRNHVEMLARLGGDSPLPEVLFQQFFAVGAAVLIEIQYDALAGVRRFSDILAKIQKRLFEPFRLLMITGVAQARPQHVRGLLRRNPVSAEKQCAADCQAETPQYHQGLLEISHRHGDSLAQRRASGPVPPITSPRQPAACSQRLTGLRGYPRETSTRQYFD